MNNIFGKKSHMTGTEHDAMQAFLYRQAGIDSDPRPVGIAAALSPFSFSRDMAILLTLGILTVLSFGSILIASVNALPGQELYPVRIDLTEPIQGALMVGSAAKAEWDLSLVYERIAEGYILKQSNNVSSLAEAELSYGLTKAESAYNATVAKVQSVGH